MTGLTDDGQRDGFEVANAEDLWKLSSFAGTFTLIEHGIQLLAENPFNDHEIAAMKLYDKDRQMKLTARLLDLAEQAREVLRDLDAVVIGLTSGLHAA